MTAHEFTIKTTDLDAGGKDYALVIRPAWIRGVLEDHEAKATTNEGQLAVRASKSGTDVVVHGTIDAILEVPCARCLERFEQPVHSDVSVLYVPGQRAKEAGENGEVEYTLEDAEADTLPYDGDTVVLDDLVRDELLLGIPMIPLCSEACPGMSPAPESEAKAASSEEKPVDPRLAPLMAFRVKTTK
ncbi:MAG: hypothetical protein JWP97_4514 [Labilithrix sp.]|nr:hypothetical protein [Labilithrix sp.]